MTDCHFNALLMFQNKLANRRIRRQALCLHVEMKNFSKVHVVPEHFGIPTLPIPTMTIII